MAWTTSAGPRGKFVPFNGAFSQRYEDLVGAATTVADRIVAECGGRLKGLGAIGLAHIATAAVLVPDASDPISVLAPLATSFVITVATLRQQSTKLSGAGRASNSQHSDLPATHATQSRDISRAGDDAEGGDTVPIAHSAGQIPATAASFEAPGIRPDLRVELMARVCHELRTPLNAVVGFSDLMEHRLFGPLGHPRYEEYVLHIRESSQKLLKSAEDTLAMTSLIASSDNRNTEPLSIHALMHEAASMNALDMERKDLSLALDFDTDLEVSGNRRPLRQAFVNLLSEAVQQANAGTSIVVTTDEGTDNVLLSIKVAGGLAVESHASLPVCLARTLLELDGCNLIVHQEVSTCWMATIALERAAQSDFFASPPLVSRSELTCH
ncbi:MAG: HAMP domain-containing histidine kinase [Hyphomicrobiaceae bacterium]|nr:HAMP domain-containing histidine kinase [Hyphomicrobiaceae bacterium]